MNLADKWFVEMIEAIKPTHYEDESHDAFLNVQRLCAIIRELEWENERLKELK